MGKITKERIGKYQNRNVMLVVANGVQCCDLTSDRGLTDYKGMVRKTAPGNRTGKTASEKIVDKVN